MNNTKAPYTGLLLKELVDSPISPRQPLVENFIYEKLVIMVYADPGVGKSVLSLCMALQASAGLPVFGFFQPVRPLKIYYCLTERGVEEPLERMQHMKQIIDINYDNIYIDEETIGINVLDPKDEAALIERIERFCLEPDIIVFDPIYAMVKGGLSDGEDATMFAQFSARIQKHFGCVNWFNHHTLKNTNDFAEGKYYPKSDPFMGSQFLKAHVTGMYYLTQSDNKCIMSLKKDSHSTMLKKFSMDFHAESYTLSMSEKQAEINAVEKSHSFITRCKTNGKKFTFDEFHHAIQPSSIRYTQKLLGVTIKQGLIFNVSTKFSNALYAVL